MKRILVLLLTLFGSTTACMQSQKSLFTSQNNAEFAQTIATQNMQLIDVRTPSEYAAGHIPRAENIDVNAKDFDLHAATLDKMHPVAVYCHSGARSKTAARKLAAQGYIVYELNRGFSAWDGSIEK